MSKEEYLKGDKKEKVLESIEKYLGFRMTDEEILMNLQDLGFSISARTLRRYKKELKEKAGDNFSQIYTNEIVNNFVEDIYTIRQLQKEGWREYNISRIGRDKLKALTLVRNATLDKFKIYGMLPEKLRSNKIPKNQDIENKTTGVEQENSIN
jgi:hypothetical protein